MTVASWATLGTVLEESAAGFLSFLHQSNRICPFLTAQKVDKERMVMHNFLPLTFKSIHPPPPPYVCSTSSQKPVCLSRARQDQVWGEDKGQWWIKWEQREGAPGCMVGLSSTNHAYLKTSIRAWQLWRRRKQLQQWNDGTHIHYNGLRGNMHELAWVADSVPI